MPDFTLKDEDINLSKKSCIGCHFEKEYKPTQNNSTFNFKDIAGVIICKLVVLIILCILYILFINKNKNIIYLLIFFILILGGIVMTSPIVIIYSINGIISLITRTPPVLNKDIYFPNYKKFENKHNFNKIKKEVMNIYKQKNKLVLTRKTFSNKYIGGGDLELKDNDGWRIYTVKTGNIYQGSETMPFLTSLLKNIPEVSACLVSILPKKKAIPIHVGYSKGVIRYLLAIKVPKDKDNVFICIDGQKHCWTEGVGIVFDDTYPHKVYNNTDEDRIVIYMDIIRPYLNPVLDYLNKFILYSFMNSSIVKNQIAITEKQIDIMK